MVKNPSGLGNTTRIMQQKMAIYLFFSRLFWVKEPRHSENIFAEKKVYLYRSMGLF